MNFGLGNVVSKARKPVPRGIARNGPPILSYGFRPFFLLAGIFAMAAMVGWIGALTCLLYTSPSPRDRQKSRMPSSA